MAHAAPGLARFGIPLLWEFPIEDGLVLARPDLEGLFFLNESARILWELSRESLPFDELVRAFGRAFNLSEERAAADVRATRRDWSAELLSPLRDTLGSPKADREVVLYSFTPLFEQNYLLHGRVMQLRIDDEEVVQEVAPRLLPLRMGAAVPEITFEVSRIGSAIAVFRDRVLVCREQNPNAARAILLQEMVRSDRPAREWLAVLHAGACGTSSACILLAASTFAGKSTLTAALMHSGLDFFCDDSAAIDRTNLKLAAMPFALMLREGSWPVLQARFPELEHCPVVVRNKQKVRFLPPHGATVKRPDADVRHLVFVRFDAEGETSLSRIGSFESLLRLRESGFWVAHERESIADFLQWVQSLPAYVLTYSKLDEAVACIRGLAGV